jgi:penicillin-binding protein 2
MNSFFARKFVIQGIFITIAVILLIRLFYIQILDENYYLSANYNAIRQIKIYPARGVILDRNNKILVQNEPVYDIMVIPNEVKPFDTLEFCRLIGIDKQGFNSRFKKAKNYSPYKASIFEKQLSAEAYASLQEKLFEFPGFFEQKRTVRSYPDSIASQFLGYIGEVTDNTINTSDGYYSSGDYIGISGVERAYESDLRGIRGVQKVMVDALNRPKGSYANGAYDTMAVAGENLVSSLDLTIQKLGEKLMRNKVGSIVAIEPATGEILAFVSSPGYDPNIMVGRERGNNYMKLLNDPHKPMFVRPIQATYSPGSSFKPLDALISLEEGLLTPRTTYLCPGGYWAGNHRVACEHVDGVTNLTKAIRMSCNTYFCNIFVNMMNKNGGRNISEAFNNWRKQVMNFGLGDKLNIDLPHERAGLIPDQARYDKQYGNGRWRSSTIISLAIGQGEMLATPLQLANLECAIANRGYYYTPHLIKSIGKNKIVKPEYLVRHDVGISPQHFEPVIDGMQEVVESGTAYGARIPNIIMCGKTGTVQNSRGKDHSVFVAFAPRDNPKIAIAVVVENAGYGSTWAAPIASYMVEQYLTDSISRPRAQIEYIMNANLLPPERPVRGQRVIPSQKDSSNKNKQLPLKKSAAVMPKSYPDFAAVKPKR